MTNKTKIISFIVLLVIIVGLVLSKSNSKSGVTIGAILPLTGTGTYWGEPVRNGIALAQAEIDKSFGAGKIKIVVEDGKSVAKDSVSAAQKLLSIDKADILYTEFSGPGLAVAPLAKSANKVIYYSAFTPKVANEYAGAIKGFISFALPCELYAKYMTANNMKKVAILSAFADVAPDCVTSLKKYLPEENILLIDNLPSNNDFRSVLLQVKNFKADAIIGMTYEGPSIAWIGQMRDLGMHTPIFSYDGSALTKKVMETVGLDNLNGTIYFSTKVNPEFEKLYKEKYPGKTDADLQPASFVYDAMINLAETIDKCKGADVKCVAGGFENKVSNAHGLNSAEYNDRRLSPSVDYYIIKNGTTTPIDLSR